LDTGNNTFDFEETTGRTFDLNFEYRKFNEYQPFYINYKTITSY